MPLGESAFASVVCAFALDIFAFMAFADTRNIAGKRIGLGMVPIGKTSSAGTYSEACSKELVSSDSQSCPWVRTPMVCR